MSLRLSQRMLMTLLAAGLLAFLNSRVAICQSCCVLPNQEETAPSGSESDTTAVGGEFVQTISNQQQPTLSYSGYTMKEVAGTQGNNGCYFTGSEIGQHPTIYGPGGNTWQVGSANQWGPDLIGFFTVDAQQIWMAEDAGSVPNGCDTLTYQTMQINCSGAYQTVPSFTDIPQDRYVYSNETMKACRSDIACSGSITIPAS